MTHMCMHVRFISFSQSVFSTEMKYFCCCCWNWSLTTLMTWKRIVRNKWFSLVNESSSCNLCLWFLFFLFLLNYTKTRNSWKLRIPPALISNQCRKFHTSKLYSSWLYCDSAICSRNRRNHKFVAFSHLYNKWKLTKLVLLCFSLSRTWIF